MPSPGRALVLTSSRDRGALAAVRALDRAGWHVGVGTPDAGGMVSASRSCRRSHPVPRPRGHLDDFVRAVRDAVAGGGYDVVFGSGDDWMAALAVCAEAIPAVVVHPPADVALAALDKAGLAQRAADAGVPVPRTEVATAEALATWSGPVVVKCRAHWQPGLRQELRIEARRYPDAGRARSRVALLEGAGFEALLQEPVDGEMEALVGLLHEGRLHGRVQQRALRLWPTPSGVTSRAVTVPVDEALAAATTRLLTDLGWSGLVQLQFLRDDQGTLRLVDLNGRFFGSLALSTAAGPNLPDAWARQALGLPLPELPDGSTGVRYLWTAGDLRRAAAERRGGAVTDALSVLRWFPGAVESVWDRRDAGPALALATRRLRRR
ncbi:ATP-grasp domain-containing protein [Blastococcus sp. SYSU DS0510]